MKITLNSRLTSAIIACSLLLNAFPSHAQYDYNNAAPAKVATIGTDSESGPNYRAYKNVHGVVQDKHGALPGATVWLHDSHTIVVTNAEGEFELRVPAAAKIVSLTCSYGGLQEEVVTFAPAETLGSVYLLRPKTSNATTSADK